LQTRKLTESLGFRQFSSTIAWRVIKLQSGGKTAWK